MNHRSARETIKSFRSTLKNIEEFTEADPASLAELKRIILKRIAELEDTDVAETRGQSGASRSLTLLNS